MLRSRASGTRLEQPAAGEQRHDREHLGARADLEDREQVGEVVAQDVAGDRDRVQAVAHACERVAGCFLGRQDADLHALGVQERDPLVYLRDQLRVVRAVHVEPEHGGHPGRPGARDGELHPVHDGDVLGLRRPPNVAGADLVLEQDLTRRVEHLNNAGSCDLEGLVVAAILLGCLRHETDVGNRADRRGVQRSVRDDVVDDGLVDAGIGRVGNHRERVILTTVGSPQLAAVADQGGHGCIDDDVRGNVQVGDAFVGVHV